MSMNVRTGFGIAALVLAIAAWLIPGTAAVWVSMAAMVLAAVAAAMRGYLLALAVLVIVLLKTFFVDPTLWTITAGSQRAGRDRSVDAIRIFLLMTMAAPVIAIAANQIYSRLTDRFIAVFAMLLLVGFLSVIAWEVPQGPLIAVFLIALVMGGYDFVRELREKPGGPDNSDAPGP